MISPTLQQKREMFAWNTIRSIDTVTLLRCEEVTDILARARRGEFDSDLANQPPVEANKEGEPK